MAATFRARLADLPDVPPGPADPAERLAGVLAAAILDRTLPEGEQVPPTAAIGHRFGTSSVTAHRAIKLLVRDGLLTRTPYGTFVGSRPAGRIT
jgi:DNA-binding GntR family transcriptional regulator